jgi:hypothetical protein
MVDHNTKGNPPMRFTDSSVHRDRSSARRESFFRAEISRHSHRTSSSEAHSCFLSKKKQRPSFATQTCHPHGILGVKRCEIKNKNDSLNITTPRQLAVRSLQIEGVSKSPLQHKNAHTHCQSNSAAMWNPPMHFTAHGVRGTRGGHDRSKLSRIPPARPFTCSVQLPSEFGIFHMHVVSR